MEIIVWEAKHYTNYYDASTEEAKQASAREIIRDLISGSYIVKPEAEPDLRYSGIDFELANLTEEEIAALPVESLRDEAKKHKRKLSLRLKQHERDIKDFDLAQKLAAGETVMYQAVNRRTNKIEERELTPWGYVQSRSGGEYEQISLESAWTPKEEA